MKLHSIFAISLLVFSSCKKTAGEGGQNKIKGSVWVQDYDSNFNLLKYEFAGIDEDVYIIYGDHSTYDEKTTTNGNGEFEFRNLRSGKYKIYMFSDKKQTTTSPAPQEMIVKEIEVSGKKETATIETFTVVR